MARGFFPFWWKPDRGRQLRLGRLGIARTTASNLVRRFAILGSLCNQSRGGNAIGLFVYEEYPIYPASGRGASIARRAEMTPAQVP